MGKEGWECGEREERERECNERGEREGSEWVEREWEECVDSGE